MDLGNGWNLPLAVTRKIALLDYLADSHSESHFTPLPSWADESGSEAHKLAVLDLRSFQASGWVNLAEDYGGGADALLLGSGWAFIEDVRAKRQDRVPRYRAARDAILHWLYSDYLDGGGHRPDLRRFGETLYALYYGEPFSHDERTKALSWLVEREFMSGQAIGVGGQILWFKITAKGIGMAESGRSVNDQEPIAAASIITHIIGDHNSVQAASPGASMVVTTTISDDHRQQSLDLAGAIEQAQSSLPAGAADAAVQLRQAVAADQGDPSVLQGALEKVKVTVMAGSADLLGKAILGGFAGLLAHYGVPL